MTILQVRLLTVATILLGFSIPATGQAPPETLQPAPDPRPGAFKSAVDSPTPVAARLTEADLAAWLDGFMPFALESGDLAGAAVVVVKDGQILLKKGYGYADVAAKRPMDPDRTLLRPGSTSKLFTWIAVMQLVEQGKLDLNRDINNYLDFRIESPFDKPITLRDLMTHRGGFEEGLKSILMNDAKPFLSTEEYLKTHQPPILFSPGEIPAYSNYGTALAGYIVQRASGEPYESYIERHIFAPLGMTRSTFRQPLPETLRADMSLGYMAASEPPRPFELLITAPAGSLSATPVDMAKFMIALLQEGRYGENQILEPATARRMYTPSVPRIDDFSTIAHGFFEEHRNGRRILGHGGDTIVFHSDLNFLIDESVGIFFSFNSRGANDSNYATRSALLDGFLDRYFPAQSQSRDPTPAAFPAEHAQLIAGRYESSRRVESAFISVFYLLEQTLITVNADGTIGVPTFPSNESKPYREIAPFMWREVDGDRKLLLVQKDGERIVFSSEDPTSVLQPVPAWRSGAWNQWVLFGSIAILLLTVILWPVAAIVQRGRGQARPLAGEELWIRRLPRIAALIDIVYLAGWALVLTPILTNHLDAYNASLDPYLRLLQVAGLLAIVAAGVGIWSGWRVLRSTGRWGSKLWHLLLALALLGVVWIGFVVKFISFSLNY